MACLPLIVVGSAVQAGGFALALRQAGATRREEVPDHPTLHRQAWTELVRRIERVLVWAKLRSPPGHVVQTSGSGTARASGEGIVSLRRGGLATDERLDALEDEVQKHRVKAVQEQAALSRKIDSAREAVVAATDRLESERKARLVRNLNREEGGVWTFIAGLALTTIGALA